MKEGGREVRRKEEERRKEGRKGESISCSVQSPTTLKH